MQPKNPDSIKIFIFSETIKLLCIKPSIIPNKNEPKILTLIIATGISKKIKFFKVPVATKYLANEPKAPPEAIKNIFNI